MCSCKKTEATSQSSSFSSQHIDAIAYDKVLQYIAFCCHTGLCKMYELFKGLKVEKQTKTRKINTEEEEKQT